MRKRAVLGCGAGDGWNLLRRRKGDLLAICDDWTAFAMTVFWVIIYNIKLYINSYTLSVHILYEMGIRCTYGYRLCVGVIYHMGTMTIASMWTMYCVCSVKGIHSA